MAPLALFVNGLPGLRVAPVTRDQARAVTDVVRDMELTYFGRSESNEAEILGTLCAPELKGTAGTVGVWDGNDLLATMLAYDALEHEQGLFLDVFVRQGQRRRLITDRLLAAARGYAATLQVPESAWLKTDSFDGDNEVRQAMADDGYEQHRVYLRMRIDFAGPPEESLPPPGLTARGMTDADWPRIHDVVTRAFVDHYDFHPLPLDLYMKNHDRETTDFSQWRLVFDQDVLVGVRASGNRFAAYRLGYVETLAVLRQYRGRGIATYLLRDAFASDHARGFVGTSLHCDATNPTGAARLYESVGMRRDQHYDAWRAPLSGTIRP